MERPDSSSEEEDDRRTLMQQTDNHRPPLPPSANLYIEDPDSRYSIRRRISFVPRKKHCVFFVFSILVILLLYFSPDIPNLFSSNKTPREKENDSLGSRMTESELEALHLLRQQQLALSDLWNHSLIYYSNSTSNSTRTHNFNSNSIEDIRFSLLKQINLNKEIQQVLLATHRSGNFSIQPGRDPDLGDFPLDRCRKVDQTLSQRQKMEWKPKSNKYLFAICVSGQMSNHLICLEKHMFFAALLNRVLVIPSPKVDYQYTRVLDIDHINKCLGRKAVLSFEEFAEVKKNHLHIDRFPCYFSQPVPCFLDEDHVKKLKNLGVSFGKLEPVWDEDTKKPNKRTAKDVESKFSSDDDVIAIGDVFFANVEQEWVMQPGGPLAHQCKTLVEPSRLILLTAQRFIQTFLGKNFIALHFRRHGFLKFCNAKQPSCFYPIPQAANCIVRVVERANAPVIYLSTDAAESETGLLQSLTMLNSYPIPLVKRPPRNSAEKWDALLYRHGIEGDSQVEAMLDKTICAMSSVFIGASGSTFTEDILRLRKDWGSTSLCDEYLCQGEEPNFIAEKNEAGQR